MARKKDVVSYTCKPIKVVKLEYPSLSKTSIGVHSFEFPTRPDGSLDEDGARKAYSNYAHPDILEQALADAHSMCSKEPSKLEEKVEAPYNPKKESKGKIL